MEPRVWHRQYDSNVPVSLEYPPYPVDYFLSDITNKYPNNTAIIFGGMAPVFGEQHSTMTYRELNLLVDRFAAGLQQLGLQQGERVAVYMPNCPQFVIAYFGILRAGGIVVPSNPLYVAREIEHQINDSGATFVVTLSLLYPNVKKIRANTSVKQVIVTNIKEYFPGLLKSLFTLAKEKEAGHRVDISGDADTIWFQDLLANAPAIPQPVEITPDDTAVLMYTGGTTGVPKGAQLTHRNVVANAIQSITWLIGGSSGDEPEVTLTALPLTHSYAMTVCMNLSLFGGHSLVLIPNPRDFDHLLNAIKLHKPTIFPGVPTLYNAINNHPEVRGGKYDIKSIRVCLSGAAALPGEVQETFQRITGGTLVEGYGLSEASPVTHANPIGSGGRTGTIGLALSDTDIKIVDVATEEEPLGPNQAGVLCVHGPQVMKGYWGMTTETANALRKHTDGTMWLHTGDIAEMDEDGYFRIVDRKKEMILAGGGLNVYPRDIEERLYEHSKIMEAAAIGVPVNSADQRTKAFVVVKEGETLTEQEVIEWCQEGLAKYKVPKYVEFRKELPKSMVGKILRRQLMEDEEKKETATA